MPVANHPLLGLWLARLAAAGVDRVVVNTHHHAGQVRSFLARHRPEDGRVVESFEPEILGTGGGLVAARPLLGEAPFLLANADVLAAADPLALARVREETGAVAVLGLVDEPRFNTVAVDGAGRVLGFEGDAGLPADCRWRTYAGLAAIAPELLDGLPPRGFSSLVEGLRTSIARGRLVRGVVLKGFWDDLGTWRRLFALHRALVQAPPPGLGHLAPREPVALAPGAHRDPRAEGEGLLCRAAGARVEAGAWLRDAVLLPGAVAACGARVREAILGDGFVARGEVCDGAFA